MRMSSGSMILRLLVVSALVLGPVCPADAADEVPLEYRIQAAFMHRFMQFVTWPETPEEMVVGFAGQTPLIAAMEDIVVRLEKGPSIRILRWDDPEYDPGVCTILYVPGKIGHLERTDHPTWNNMSWLSEYPVLTVGEDPEFLSDGGMVTFYLEAERVRFAIHPQAVDMAGLKISSNLMRLARIHGGPPN